MQRCQYCGAEFPDNVGFCSNCGRPSAAFPAPQMAANQGGMPQSPGAWQPTQPDSGAWQGQSQPPQQQGGAWQGQPQQQGGPWQGQPQPPQQSGAWPGQSQPPSYQSAWPQAGQPPMQQPGTMQSNQVQQGPPGWQMPQQGNMPPFKPDQKGKGGISKLVIIAVVALLIIGGAVGVYAFTHNSGTNGTGINANATSTTNPQHNPTHGVGTGITPPIIGNSPIPGGSAIPSCLGSGNSTGSLSFTGAVSGQMTTSLFLACNSSSSGKQEYVILAEGTIGSSTYQFYVLLEPYTGPGTYNPPNFVDTVLSNSSNSTTWGYSGVGTMSATVNADGKSGKLSATIVELSPTPDPTSVVNVTGSWMG